MPQKPPSRREVLRTRTSDEIKQTALDLMASGGPDAITLRAIAREMGLTAGALYGYFATRDDLVTTLIDDLYRGLVDRMEVARDAAHAPEARMIQWGSAFRAWAVENPPGFRLVYGDPVPGYRSPPGGAAPEAELRACVGLIGLVQAARGPGRLPGATWGDFEPATTAKVREAVPGLDPSTYALALRVWGRMHGLVALEMHGHLKPLVSDAAKLYQAELKALLTELRR